MARSRKLNLKSILKVVAFAALAILLIGGISSCFSDDTDTVSIFKFERGELDSNGAHVESKRAIYTKNAFECQGLEIVPDFDAHASYDVYYYDADDNFLDSVTGLTKKYTYDHSFATHARVVIYPDVPEDESEENYEIPFYEVYTIANKLNITVSEKQNYKKSLSFTIIEGEKLVSGGSMNSDTEYVYSSNSNYKVIEGIEFLNEYNYYEFYFAKSKILSSETPFIVLQSQVGDSVFYSMPKSYQVQEEKGNFVKITVDITTALKGDSFAVSLPIDSYCSVFPIKK